jgi:hypothetical protein
LSHRTVSVTFDREFRLPRGCPRDGEVECQAVFADCRITSFVDDLLAFKVILVLKITIRKDGFCCCLERELVLHDLIWMDGLTMLGCEVARTLCRCRVRHGRVRCAGVAEVRFRVKGGCHCPCRCDWQVDRSGSANRPERRRSSSSSSLSEEECCEHRRPCDLSE